MPPETSAAITALPPLSLEGEALLKRASAPWLTLTPTQVAQFGELYTALQQGSAAMNLTAVLDERGVVLKHFVDSLSLLQSEVWAEMSPSGEPLKVLDLGTGGGFPALPLAIARPQDHITALDATAKKVDFVQRTADSLGLSVSGLVGRAEEVGRDPQHREAYNIVVTRAVAALPVLAELCLPLLKTGGYLMAMKAEVQSGEAEAGTAAIAEVGGKVISQHAFALPEQGDPRTLVVACKVVGTPERYPRRTGVPNKRPLHVKHS